VRESEGDEVRAGNENGGKRLVNLQNIKPV
jgi:hypothetical protein